MEMESLQSEIVTINADSIRVGSYELKSSTHTADDLSVRFSTSEIIFRIPHEKTSTTPSGLPNLISVWIPFTAVLVVETHFGGEMPQISLKISRNHAKEIRNRLGMDVYTFNNEDSRLAGNSSDTHRTITIQFKRSSCTEAAKNFIMSNFRLKGVTVDNHDTEFLLSMKSHTIFSTDIQGLKCGGLLNDTIVSLWLDAIFNYKLSEDQKKKTFIFDTLFYTRLSQNLSQEADSELTAKEIRYERVKKWTKKVDIFEKDFLIVPINEGVHWFLAIICFPGLEGLHDFQTLEPLEDAGSTCNYDTSTTSNYNDLNQRCIKRPCILLYDSLEGITLPEQREHVYKYLFDYLEAEFKMKKQRERVFDVDTFPGFLAAGIPKQENDSNDCGLFMLQYVEIFFFDPVPSYDRIQLSVYFNKYLFKPGFGAYKRKEIYDFIKRYAEHNCPEKMYIIPKITFS